MNRTGRVQRPSPEEKGSPRRHQDGDAAHACRQHGRRRRALRCGRVAIRTLAGRWRGLNPGQSRRCLMTLPSNVQPKPRVLGSPFGAGRSPWGTRPRVLRLRLWSGIRTRDSRIHGPMLYPSELSMVSACGTRTRDLRTWLSDALSTELMPSLRNPLLPAEAYATAAPRAPDGRSNPYRNEPEKEASHCRRFTAAIPAGRCGPAAALPESCRPTCVRVLPDRSRTPKKKNPRVKNPRAFASPRGDRGSRSPGGRSADGIHAAVRQSASRHCPHTRACNDADGLRIRVAWKVRDAVHVWVCSGTMRRGAAWGAHDTPDFRAVKPFVSRRRSRRRRRARHCQARQPPWPRPARRGCDQRK